MIRKLALFYARYQAAHLVVELSQRPIVDRAGERVGYIDRATVANGRLQVQGWAVAQKLRLVHGAAEAVMAPVLRRADVASALGTPEAVGFDLSVPARLQDVLQAVPPGLVIQREAGETAVDPISLGFRLSRRAVWRVRMAFLRDMALSAPDIAAWLVRGDPACKARVIARMGLETVAVSGLLESRLFRDPDAVPAVVPPERVTIVLPVYNAFDLLRDCLARIARHTDLPWHLILIEDGSTDARVLPFVRRWAAEHDNVELLENPVNGGFIASVNRGLARAMEHADAGEGPVILLNSDALVPAGWASRLVRPFYTHADVATVTPMSNDAEIFSVPKICARTVLTPGQGDAIDAVARCLDPEALVSVVPTGVGFCMAMGRDWLRQVPQLDTVFGRGYGEEVDWCQKVAQRGGRHLGLPGLFVEHRGGESFGSVEKAALIEKHNRIVSGRYPDYDQSVQRFVATDPMRGARLALALAWAGSRSPDIAVPVYLAHAMGGGADHWLEHRIAEDLAQGLPSVVLRVGQAHRWCLELRSPQGQTSGDTDDADTIRQLLAVLPRKRVIYSCGVGHPDPAEIPAFLLSLLGPDDQAEVLFHDYFPLSPSYTLLDSDGIWRGPVVPPRDDPAHQIRRPDGRLLMLGDWQAAWKQLADNADLVVFSQASADLVAAVWPDLSDRIILRPHALRHAVPRLPQPGTGAPCVLAVLGNIGQPKGARVVQDLSQRLGRDGPRLVVVGNVDPNFALPAHVTVHGSYRVDDLPQLVRIHGITHWLIPSVWPETFCYTVREALATGLPTLTFDLGAQAEAARRAENGIVLPFAGDADLAQAVLDAVQTPIARKGTAA